MFLCSAWAYCVPPGNKSTCLERKPLNCQSPHSTTSCNRATLWILLRITLLSTLVRALNGHPGRPISPLSSQGSGCHTTAPSLYCLAETKGHPCWQSCVDVLQHPWPPIHRPCLPPQLPLQLDELKGLIKKMLKWEVQVPLSQTPTMKLLEPLTPLSLLSHGHRTKAVRIHGL